MRRVVVLAFVVAACSGGNHVAPASQPASSPCEGAPPDPSYVCARACPPPIARPDDPPPGYVWAPPNRVRDGKVFPCPICLPAGTRIATPAGDRPVETLRAGDVVWSRDVSGRRVAARLVEVAETPVLHHRLVRVALSDGRVVDASPGHPTTTGQPLGELVAGDVVDGAKVERVTVLDYAGSATYDILPEGATGMYFAGDVALSSTLPHI